MKVSFVILLQSMSRRYIKSTHYSQEFSLSLRKVRLLVGEFFKRFYVTGSL